MPPARRSASTAKKKVAKKPARKAAQKATRAEAPAVKRRARKAAPKKQGQAAGKKTASGTSTRTSQRGAAAPRDTNRKRVTKEEILLTLRNEHRYMDRVLEPFEEQLEILKDGGTADYNLMYDVIHYMSRFPARFHHPREDVVFRKLMERDEEIRSQVETAFVEHESLENKGRTTLKALKAIGVEDTPERRRSLEFRADDYLASHHKHVDRENGKIFLRIEALTDADWEEIAAQVQLGKLPLFGERVGRQYQSLNEYLSDQLEHVADEFTLLEYFGLGAFVETIGTVFTSGSEIRSVIDERVRKASRINARGYRRLMKPRSCKAGDYIGIPVDCMLDSFDIYTDSLREVGDILRKARRRIAEPYNSRMEMFREMEIETNAEESQPF